MCVEKGWDGSRLTYTLLFEFHEHCYTNDEQSAAQTLANSLTEIAMGRQSSDNISVVVVDLKSKKKLQKT